MSTVRELVDPYNTLPDVELVRLKTTDWDDVMTGHQMSIELDGAEIGMCHIIFNRFGTNPHAHFDTVRIIEELRGKGKGMGLATYILAIEMSHAAKLGFQTQNSHLSLGAKKIWDQLIVRGVAEVLDPFTQSQAEENRFYGKARVPFRSD